MKWLVAGCAVVAGLGWGEVLPSPPRGDACFPELRRVVDDASARKTFAAADETPPAEYAGAGCVRLPVLFSRSKSVRVSWDVAVKADLRGVRGVQFDFFCRDLEPFSSFSIYFHSGGGWYHASFSPEESGVWQHIVADKAEARTEGQPGGWGTVDRIRISGWRGSDADTVCALANLGPVGGRPEALVVRADSNLKTAHGEGRALGEYAGTVSTTLDKLGVASAQVSDLDLSPELLEGIRLVVLPYNPSVPGPALGLLKAFTARGGKLLVCYSLPSAVGDLLGLCATGSVVSESRPFAGFARTTQGLKSQPVFAPQASWRTVLAAPRGDSAARVVAVWRDSAGADTALPAVTLTAVGAFVGHVWFYPANESGVALMRSVVGELVPDVWRRAAEQAYAGIGAIAGAKDFDALRAALGPQASADVRRALEEAGEGRREVKRLLEAGEWSDALAARDRASAAALRAWCLNQKSASGEQRAFWCHSAFGLGERDWDASIRLLKENGFNAILPNMLWGGLAYYPSKVLPEYAELGTRGDQVAQCLAACRKYGVRCHVWKVNWNTGGRAPREFLDRMRADGRTQKAFGGESRAEWLCPSHPANQDMEVAAMLEVVRNYTVDGVHFDYIRYPGDEACFCDGCRARFEAALGRAVAEWPADVRRPGDVRDRWLDFRRSNINAVVRRVSEEARKIRPGVRISAAVFRNWPVDRDGVGQDWKLWCDNGWMDFVCPMDYIDSNRLFGNAVAAQKGYAGRVPLYPGIGLSCWKNPRDAVKLAQQIAVVRGLGLKGFTVFNFDANAESVLPFLRLGCTRAD